MLPEKGGDFWTVDFFLEELENLLHAHGIADQYFLLGQSWGGMLAAEHAIRRPKGLQALVISNSPASMELWASEAKIMRGALPPEVEAALDRHEAVGTTSDPEYLAAQQLYYDEHVCRVVPNPPEVLRMMEFLERDSTVYNTMNGPNEFFCIGTLRDWSVVDRASIRSSRRPCCSRGATTRRRPRRYSRSLTTSLTFVGRSSKTRVICRLSKRRKNIER